MRSLNCVWMTSYHRYCRHHKIAYHIFHQNLRYHQIMNDIPPSLVVFLNQHWPAPSSVVLAPNKTLVSRNLLENQIFSLRFPFTGRGQIYFFFWGGECLKKKHNCPFSLALCMVWIPIWWKCFCFFQPSQRSKEDWYTPFQMKWEAYEKMNWWEFHLLSYKFWEQMGESRDWRWEVSLVLKKPHLTIPKPNLVQMGENTKFPFFLLSEKMKT